MTLSFGYWLLVYAAIAIIALIVLIARYRLNPFIVITLISIGLALVAGMPPSGVVGAYEAGVGKTLGHIALVVALGTMLGKMMAESGGAEQVARTLIDRFGEKNAHWAMVCIAFLVGLPLFFEVGGADVALCDCDRYSDSDHRRSPVRQVHCAAYSIAGGKPAGASVPRTRTARQTAGFRSHHGDHSVAGGADADRRLG